MKLRAPAVPLITYDPYFSIWSMSDRLNEDNTKHWTGAYHPILGEVITDSRSYSFMGDSDCEKMEQISVDITPLSSTYRFSCSELELELIFTTPLLLNDLKLMARPITYIAVKAIPKTEIGSLSVRFRFDDAICLSEKGQYDTQFSDISNNGLVCGKIGSIVQNPLNKSGDLIRLDWGYLYIATLGEGASIESLGEITENNTQSNIAELSVSLKQPTFSAVIAVGYDDIYAIEYFNKPLELYWKKEEKSLEKLIVKSLEEYSKIKKRCDDFDKELCGEAEQAGGEIYKELLSLAYRQSIAAHKLCEDTDGNLLFISKECGSGACAATADVSYPSMPLFLLYNPALIDAMMRPIFKYARSSVWFYEFAPHDAGFYPLLNGQTYSNGTDPKKQMPIEECGNMLIMMAATSICKKDISFAKENWDLLEQWCGYLIRHGLDPDNQLCTDDFAGHMAHNCNLSIKAIMGIASFGILCGMNGMPDKKDTLINTAKELAAQWVSLATNEDGTFRLAFDKPGSFSMKYNAVWDQLFETGIFPEGTFSKELSSYIGIRTTKYGMPLDNRNTYTKSDWILWCATMFESREDFIKMITPLWTAYNESETRFAMGDWYYTDDAHAREFQNRSVQAGLFIRLLKEKKLCVD